MRAFIKSDKWAQFVVYALSMGFMPDELPTGEPVYCRNPRPDLPNNHTMLVITSDMELHLLTPLGESPFMEAHKNCFEDLIDKDWIEFVKGDFD